MKYLIQNRKEVAITIAAFVMAVINLIRAIKSKDITQDLIVAVLVTGSTVLAWYYNMPTSAENCEHTGQMRAEKEYAKNGTDGEDFFEEADEDEELADEDFDEWEEGEEE